MSRMPNVSDPKLVACSNCSDVTDEWGDVNVSNVVSGDEVEMVLCVPCLDIMALLLDVDLEANPEGLFRMSSYGKLVSLTRDNN